MDPGNETTPTDEASTPTGNAAAPSGTTRRPIKGLSGQEWETYRDIIKDLYNRMSLKEVIAYMSERYNFIATARMYKTRLNQWGLNKYMKKGDMQSLVQRMQSSKDPNVPMEIDGKTVPRAKVERYAKRKGQALDKEGLATSTTPLNSNSPSRMDSIGDGYVHVELTGQEIEFRPEDAPSPATTIMAPSASPPAQVDQLPHVVRILPAPIPPKTTAGPFTESPEPGLIGSFVRSPSRRLRPLQSNAGQGSCPPAPRLHTRSLKSPMQTDIIQQALLLAIMLSAMIQQRPLGDIADVRIDDLEQKAGLNMNVLSAVIDLLGWLQLDRRIVFLAVVYLVRFDASASFPKSHNVWQQLLVALRFAHIYLHDEPYSGSTWIRAIPHLANSSIGQGALELHVLADEHIRLHVEQSKWRLLETRLSHISTSLLDSFERGIFTFETTQQKSGGPMELTSSGFL
jgi:hypothetical protein